MEKDKNILKIIKINESYIKLFSENKKILDSIWKHFSVYQKNFMFSPLYQSGKWKGKIRFFNLKTEKLAIGLLRELISFLKEERIKFEYHNFITEKKKYTLKIIKKYFEKLKSLGFISDKINFETTKGFSLRDYQKNSILTFLNNKKIIVKIPTAGGKSVIIFLFALFLLKIFKKKSIFIIVPNKALVSQLKQNFIEYSNNEEFIEKKVSVIYGEIPPEKRDLTKPIVISTWQSLLVHKDKINFKKVDSIIVDEVHTALGTNMIKEMLKKSINCEYKVGLTGSLDLRDKSDKFTYLSFFGKVKTERSIIELVKEGILSKFKINPLLIQWTFKDEFVPYFDYFTEVDYFERQPEKYNLVFELLKSFTGQNNTLILFKKIDNAKNLKSFLENKFENKKILYIDGKVNVKEREEMKTILEQNNDVILIASYGTFSVGIDIYNIHNIIFYSSTKSIPRVLQSIGRGLRNMEGKFLNIWDIVDLANKTKYKKQKRYLFSHFKERLYIIYTEEKMITKIYTKSIIQKV